MGTVGLSFGSPTSGAGFNVSTTVAEIVGNLQNVETPWKTELTSLESQDTAISSLGTLFSKLSNDLSSLTDLQGILSQKTGSSSDTNVLTPTAADSTAVAGTHTVTVTSLAQTASGYLAPIAKASDTLSGSITIKAGNGAAQTFTMNSSNNTLAGLAAAINSSGAGVTASVLTDSSGSRLSLVSGTSGANGKLSISANSIADATASSGTLAYTAAVAGADAQLTVDGVNLTSASNTVANLVPGVTFQLLAPSAATSGGGLEQIQLVIGNDNGGVESAVNQMVSDYNSLTSAMNAQEGKDSSGKPEPLFGSPTLSLLQQQLMGGLNLQSPNGALDAISTSNGTTLSGSMTIQVGSGAAQKIVFGASPSGAAQDGVFYTGSGVDTLSGLASAINAAKIGVIAGVATSGGMSSLTLRSQTAGSSGALTVTSGIQAASGTPLAYSQAGGYTSTTADTGTVGTIPSGGSGDQLSGSISIQVGSGAAQTVTMPSSPDNTLSGLAAAINNTANIGVKATVVTDSATGAMSLSLVSDTVGSAGALRVSSNLLDTTQTTSTALNYTSASDINSLTGLGIGVKTDGSLSFNAATLDSALNSDFSSVAGFFQNANGWGQKFSATLASAGVSSSSGVLSLASTSNSSIESTLNADISREESTISAEQKSLTAELNSANEVMQQIPSLLDQVNELYSAITGYNKSNG